jgi:hypothetical protein
MGGNGKVENPAAACASTRNTYSTWNRIVGTVKKSTETMILT